jgi:hypothetical protein
MHFLNRQIPVLPGEVLFDLINRLDEPRFMGVPIGLTLTTHISTGFPSNPVAALRAFLAWARFYWVGPRKCLPLPKLERNRVLLTWLADTPRLNELVLPVLNELAQRSCECNVIAGLPSLRSRLSPEVGFCTGYQICKVDMAAWRREYRQCCGLWHQQIRVWLREHRLSLWLFPYLAYAVATRTLYVFGFFRFLEQVQPAVILTDSEHGHPWACLILAARELKIPTLQMMHGVIYSRYGYQPLLSDVALCWGEQQKEQMISFGTEPERLLLAGCQRLRRESSCDANDVRQRLGLPLKRPVVMLATNPMERNEWRKLVSVFGDAFRENGDVVAVVKLHPSEKRSNYCEEIAQQSGIRFFEGSEWTVEESMAVCAVVVSHNSGLGNDALVLGRPVVLLDVLEEPLSNGRGLADKAGCPVVKTTVDLRAVVLRILSDEAYRLLLHAQAEKYVKWFCCAYGQEAARNVACEVMKRRVSWQGRDMTYLQERGVVAGRSGVGDGK